MSQSEFSELLRIPRSTLQNWEQGRTARQFRSARRRHHL
ncbi:helix-turn-helix domain-containing protein [Aurantimonas sp. A2-1-M11]